ncbi:MAG: hypothetical protein ACKN81_04020, partial [Pirellulaceae bacterium]
VCEAVDRHKTVQCDRSLSRTGLPKPFVATAEHTTMVRPTFGFGVFAVGSIPATGYIHTPPSPIAIRSVD